MQKSLKTYPKRGEIFVADLNPSFGREIHKKRPVLIVSTDRLNEATTHAIIIPSSTQVPKIVGPDMVKIGQAQGLDKPSILLPLFIRSIDQDRLIKQIGTIDEKTMQEIEESLNLVLDLAS